VTRGIALRCTTAFPGHFGIQYDRETQSIAVFALFLVGEADPTSSGHALGMGIGLLLRSQRCIDLASNSASG